MAELTTVSAVKAYLGISASTFDTLLATLLDAAEMAMRRRYNRPDGWTQAVFTEKFDGEIFDKVIVRNVPVDTSYSSQSLTVDSVTVNSTAYDVDTARGIFGFKATAYPRFTDSASVSRLFPDVLRQPDPNMGLGFRNVTVVYRGGYLTIPSDLAMAAQVLTAGMFNLRGQAGFTSHTLGQHSFTLGDGGGMESLWQAVDAFGGAYAREVLV